MDYGDPLADEAIRLLLRAAAAEDRHVAGPEVTRIRTLLQNDQRLLAWFIYVAARVAMVHVRELAVDFQGDPNEAMLRFEEALQRAFRGERD